MPRFRPGKATKQRILERDDHTCQYCGGHAQQTDHVVPWSKCHVNRGNMVATCRRCNALAGAFVFASFEAKKAYILARREGLTMNKAKKAALAVERIDDIFEKTEQRKRKPSPYDVSYPRATYRIKLGTQDQLKAIAQEAGVGLNDLVRWVFQQFIDGYESKAIELPIEEYVVTKSRLSA